MSTSNPRHRDLWVNARQATLSWRAGDTALCFLLLVISVTVRWPLLALKPFWIAEIQSFSFAWQGGFFDNWLYSAGDILGFFTHKVFAALGFAPSPLVIRFLPAVLGTALVPCLYAVLRLRWNRLVSLLTSLLVAINVPLVSLSQQGRLYVGVAVFSGLAFALDMSARSGSRKHIALGVLDSMAVLSHPYGILWAGMRWGFRWLFQFRQMLSTWKSVLPAMALPLPFLGAQFYEIWSAMPAFLELHNYFSLGTITPNFSIYAELVGQFAGGPGWSAATLGLFVLGGIVTLSQVNLRTAQFVLMQALITPMVVLIIIWVGHARFSFAHLPAAAVPLFFLATQGLLALAAIPRTGRLRPWVAALLACTVLLPNAHQTAHYLARPTHLELGANYQATCQWLGDEVDPDDYVLTHYDKYFTSFAWECGPRLDPDVSIATPRIPSAEWTLKFLHLEGTPGTPRLSVARMIKLETMVAQATPGERIFFVLPYREQIAGEFSETIGWFEADSLYGPLEGPRAQDHPAFQVHTFDGMAVFVLTVPDGGFNRQVQNAVDALLFDQWPII